MAPSGRGGGQGAWEIAERDLRGSGGPVILGRLRAEAAGFRLLASSEVNANPKDSRDHPKGVWTLPPSLRLKDQNRDIYLAPARATA
jgi:hypothetical protein